jgi:hypothetical protein
MDLSQDTCTNYCRLLLQQRYLVYMLHSIFGGNFLVSFQYDGCNPDDPEVMLSLAEYLEHTGQSIGFLIHKGNSYTVSFLWQHRKFIVSGFILKGITYPFHDGVMDDDVLMEICGIVQSIGTHRNYEYPPPPTVLWTNNEL